MIATTDVFLEHNVSIYFLAIAVKSHFKSDSYPWKLVCTLLSLMNKQAAPSVDSNRDNIHHYIELFTVIMPMKEDVRAMTTSARGCPQPFIPCSFSFRLFANTPSTIISSS